MATASRPEDPGLKPLTRPEDTLIAERLREQPWQFQFFQAVRLMQRLFTEREPVGIFARPDKEIVHFRVHQSLVFPPSQIQQMEVEEGETPEMTVAFMGLTGPAGVLPHVYTEMIKERQRSKDHTLDAFLNIFNHRAISLFYQAWEKHHFPVRYERRQDDRFTKILLDLVGLGAPGLQNRQAIEDQSLIYYTGLLGLQPRSATALKQVLEDYFDVPVEIEEFVGSWSKLGEDNQCSLAMGNAYSEQVGLGVVVGDEIWDQQSRARIKIGPVPLDRYRDFLPTGSAYEPLKGITKFFAGNEIEFEVQLILQREEVPACDFSSGVGLQLGWVTWMKSVPSFDRNPEDTILLLM